MEEDCSPVNGAIIVWLSCVSVGHVGIKDKILCISNGKSPDMSSSIGDAILTLSL